MERGLMIIEIEIAGIIGSFQYLSEEIDKNTKKIIRVSRTINNLNKKIKDSKEYSIDLEKRKERAEINLKNLENKRENLIASFDFLIEKTQKINQDQKELWEQIWFSVEKK